MKTVNPSAQNERKVSVEEYPASGFFQALRDKSIYARVFTPPGLKALAIAIVLSLLHGLIVFVNAGNATDLSTSIAFITMFAIVLGSWLGLLFGLAVNRLMKHALDILEYRAIKLVELRNELIGEHAETIRQDEDTPVEYWTSIVTWMHVLSYPALGCCLMFLVLQGYTYAGAPDVSALLSPTINAITVSLYISLATCIFLTGWVGASILRIWHRIRTLEREGQATALDADIRALAPLDISSVGYINRAHRQTVRFVTGVF